MIGILFAALSILVQPTTPPDTFIDAAIGHCEAIVRPGEFIGCVDARPSDDDRAYAGLVWIDGVPSLVTGP